MDILTDPRTKEWGSSADGSFPTSTDGASFPSLMVGNVRPVTNTNTTRGASTTPDVEINVASVATTASPMKSTTNHNDTLAGWTQSFPSKRVSGSQRPEASPVVVTPSASCHNNNPNTTRKKIACALKALKCSSRASKEEDQALDNPATHNDKYSAYDMSLFNEGQQNQDEIFQPRSPTHLFRQTTMQDVNHKHSTVPRWQQQQQQHPPQEQHYFGIQKKMDHPEPAQSSFSEYLNNTTTFEQSMHPGQLNATGGVESSHQVQGVDDDDDVYSILRNVADATHHDIGARWQHSHFSTHSCCTGVVIVPVHSASGGGVEIFSDDNDHYDDEYSFENQWTNDAKERLYDGEQQQQQQPILEDPHKGEDLVNDLNIIRDTNVWNAPHASTSFWRQEEGPGDGGTTTISWTLPIESSFIEIRQPSNDSNDTPTTCNRNRGISPATPETTYNVKTTTITQSHKDQNAPYPLTTNIVDICDVGSNTIHQHDWFESRWGDSDESLKQILHHNLSLGDALSPTGDEDSPLVNNTKDGYFTNEVVDEMDTILTTSFVDATLSLPNMFVLDRQLIRSKNEEGKTDNEDGKQLSSSSTLSQRCDTRILLRRRSDTQTTKFIATANGPSVTHQTPIDDTSFSTVSSFTIPFLDGKATTSTRESILLKPNHNMGGNKPVTPHPFFWRSHPTVTVKSYDYIHQPMSVIRRVDPRLEPVRSTGKVGTFRSNNVPFLTSREPHSMLPQHTGFCIDENATMYHKQIKDDGIKPQEGKSKFSPYLHHAINRRMGKETQRSEFKLNAKGAQNLEGTSHCVPQDSVTPRSARDIVHSLASYANTNMAAVFIRLQSDRPLKDRIHNDWKGIETMDQERDG
jgi:hypothetical protein